MICNICKEPVDNNTTYMCPNLHKFHCIINYKKGEIIKCTECNLNLIIYSNNLFTTKECEELIIQSNNIGFTDTQTNKFGEEYIKKDMRNNTACVISNDLTTTFIYDRIKKFIPFVDNIYGELRVTKYEKGQFCGEHTDNKFMNYKHNDKIINSKYTFMLYLSDCEGGDLILNMSNFKKITIKPKMGSIIIFDQSIYHSAKPVIQGVKYNLRTELITYGYDENQELRLTYNGLDS